MTEENQEKSTTAPAKKSRRGMTRYAENPFLDAALASQKTRTKRITNSTGDHLMIVSENTGEVVGPAGFWHTEEVDQTKFIKLYVNGVKAVKELTSAGTKLLELLYLEMQRNIGKDQAHMSFAAVDQTLNPISEATFYRGMKELVEKGFLAESMSTGLYFVNPDYLWNGDRLAFVKEYRLKQRKRDKHAIADTHTLSLPFDQPQE